MSAVCRLNYLYCAKVTGYLPKEFFSLETAGMRKKDWTMIVLIIAVLLLILIVYFIFEKRIEAIPDKIN